MNSTPTVAERERLLKLARSARLERSSARVAPIEPVDRGGRLALSFAQQRLWFLEQLGGMGSTYHVRRRLRLRGELDRPALLRALDRVVARHEALRTTFALVDGEPEQRIAPAEESGLVLPEHDLRGHPGAEAELERLIAGESDAPFDLECGPLVRGRLVRLGEDEHVLLLTMHHIVSDAWSMGVLVHELSVLYAAFHRGEGDPLAPLPVQYADYAAWQRRWVEGEVLQAQASYWKRTLAGAPELLELPADHARPARQDHRGGRVRVALDEELGAGLRALGRRHGTTLFMTLLAGWATVMNRLSGQEDVVVGTPTANRERSEVEGLIGFFLNTLALRVDLSDSPTVAGLLARVRERALEAQQNQDIPFEQVVELVQPARSLAHNPVFQVMFTWQNTPGGKLDLPGLTLESVQADSQAMSKVDLSLTLRESDGRIEGGVQYAAALFEPATVERYVGYLRRVLAAMAADDGRRTGELEILPAAERAQVVEAWNATGTAYRGDACAHHLFEAQVERTPHAPAVAFEGESLTYAELNRRANRLAHFLVAGGVGPDVRVGLCVERGPEMMVAVLGVLKAGGAYVPLDPSYPEERLRYMLRDSAPAVLLAGDALAERFADMGVPVVAMGADAPGWAGLPEGNPDGAGLTPEHLVYVIYTSGSTGRPKGVMNVHRNLANRIGWMQDTWGLNARESLLQSASLSFDVSAYEMLWPLTVGARVVLARPEGHKDPAYLVETLRAEKVSVVSVVPSMLRILLEHPGVEECVELRRVPCGGEALPPGLAQRFYQRLPRARLHNRYGPSEAAVAVSGPVSPPREEAANVPIGRPIANVRTYVLDGAGDPVPVGVVGELFIGGAGVGRGYLDRPGLTAEKFVPDPFGGEPGARVYRTGDLARWLPDGRLEFLGRNDFQVKVRGLRVELREIEVRLAEHAAVREVVVLAREDAAEDRRLVAYYVADAPVGVEALRSHLGERLPEHMVPAAYVHLERLPLTPSGKLDRGALPAPDGESYARRGYEAPAGEAEEVLAGIWSELLRVERVSRWDHFFELGGHSLLAVQVGSRVRRALGVEVPLGRLFERPVLADFARGLEQARRSSLPAIETVDRGGRLPLSFAQQRLWLLEQFGNLGSTYYVRRRLSLRGALDRAALVRALDRIVERHEVLRTTFQVVDGEPEQRIAPAEGSRFALLEHDLAEHPGAEAELSRLVAEEAVAPFDLERGPLIRGRLIRLGEESHVLLLTLHHVVSDAWSMGVLVGELGALYAAYHGGSQDPLPALPVQYADYAAWQRRWVEGEVLRAQAEYWVAALAGAPELLALPTDRPRPARQDHAGASVPVQLDGELTAALRALGRRQGTTLFMTLLAGWAATLGRLSGQQDVVVGTPTANRGRREIEGLIGFFLNTLPLRIDLGGAPTVAELLGRVRDRALEAQQNQDIPFEEVVERVRPERSLAHGPVFQVLFAWQSAPQAGLVLPGVELSPARGPLPDTSKFDLALSLQESGGRIVGRVEYATALFERATVERHVGYLRRVLEGIAAGDDRLVERLEMLPEAERRQVVEGWNATGAAYPGELCLHQLFEAQAERTPEAVAVVHEGAQLTYAELNRRANRLAHHLGGLGVVPDARVGISVERGPEMIVALLAALKAGGAYVPLDPAYPEERLRYMLRDSAPAVVLTQEALAGPFADLRVPVLHLDGAAEWGGAPETDPERGVLTSAHAAYVIYTSGSTGLPKGVVIEHRNAVNFLSWARTAFDRRALERTLFSTSLSFDLAVFECFAPLTVGACVQVVRDALALAHAEAEVTLVNTVPSAMKALVEAGGVPRSVRTVNLAGEPLKQALVEQIFAATDVERVCNLYGPSETTTYSTWVEMERGGGFAAHIGRPLANTRVYVLDGRGEPVPVGVVGELHVGGAGVARGYLGRPELTAERFVPDAFGGEAGARLYRTGDLARWLAEGNVEFLGRNDHQVKVRGFRIELGEIEARLAEHAGVREAVVTARSDAPGDTRLVAYYVAEQALDAGGLRAYLGERLPEHMVPAAYVWLAGLPLTPNGKLDRRALPAPDGAAFAARGYEAPVGELEAALAEIWAEVLGVERVGRRDDFFELGGHSLRAVQIVSRVQQVLGMEAALGEVFERPVLAAFARGLVQAGRAELPAIEPADRGRRLALSFGQQRLWFLEQLGNMGSSYHIRKRLRMKGELDRGALARALDGIVARHEALRTVFVVVDGEPEQRVVPTAESRFHLVEHDLGEHAAAETELRRLMAEEAVARFDLEAGPLFRGRLVRLGEDDHVLLLTMHHIVSDAWSVGVLLGELSALYASHRRGEADPLPPLPVQYADYAAWQRRWVNGEVLERQAAYWTATLSGAPELLELPTDRARPAQQDFAGGLVRVVLDEELTAGLVELSRRNRTTLFMTVLAGWATVLGRLSGQPEVVVGTPAANRGRREIEGLIGFFVNTLALRVGLSGSPTVAELLGRVKARSLEAQQNQDISFEEVVDRVQPERSLAHTPVFQVLFAWQSTPQERLELPGLELAPVQGASQATSKFDMVLALQKVDGRITGLVEYATALFDRATIERFVGYLRRVLQEMVADDRQRVDRLDVLPEAERRQVVGEWNATEAEYPREACLHELFEAHVARAPGAVALAHGGGELSYAGLNARANRLAHALRARGVGPDVRVGLCVERGPEMVTALLAVLKAGGAYVPLDPEYPEERLRHMLADSAPAVLLTQASLRGRFADLEVPTVSLDAEAASWEDRPPTDLAREGLTPAHLAYVIYTSGSTGTPKGVMVPHRGVCNLVAAQARGIAVEPGSRVLQFASFSFDACVFEVAMALCQGVSLHLPPAGVVLAGETLVELLARERITHVTLPPAVLGSLPEDAELESVRTVVLAGDVVTAAVSRRWAPGRRLFNAYGPTEATVWATLGACRGDEEENPSIGRPIANARMYVLDGAGEPVPVGVVGELHIGGAGVARGYLGRAELTAERFVPDAFGGEAGARLYRTGDLGRWRADGTLEFGGRNDAQVKLRGYRIEPGEIEARLLEHAAVREAVVQAREDAPGERRLVAYYVAEEATEVEALRAHLAERLPEYMVPAAYVRLEALPLTPNGKLDRGALPAPEGGAFTRGGYEAPVGEVEEALAEIWAELLGVERVGRHDHFFELGGHSLLAVRLVERMRRRGMHAEVGALFTAPTLAGLAAAVGGEALEVAVPPNAIPAGSEAITPEMLPLVELGQAEIDTVVAGVPGGARNVQDVYPLAPLQEGMLFHHLLSTEGDPYLSATLSSFDARERLDAYLGAFQAVIDRHDVLRTSVAWEGLREPVQVVWREARLQVEEVELDPAGGDAAGQLYARFDPRRHRLDVRRAPLLRVYAARDAERARWLLLLQLHHLAGDHTTLEVLQSEVSAHLLGRAHELPAPLPFRNYVAQARLGVRPEEHEAYFRELLAGVDEPTAPFGLLDAWGDGSGIEEARQLLDPALSARLRERARALGVSAASVCHVAWAQVLARVSGRDDVVFGTVLFGRMQGGEGSDRVLGPFINTLPVRLRVGAEGVEAGVRGAHRQLAELLRHEHASLALAQRCSAVEAPAPLFTALLNYRHSAAAARGPAGGAREGIRKIRGQERTNYPVMLSVDDLGEGMGLAAQVPASVGAGRVCALMNRALEGLVEALERAPGRALAGVEVLPEAERARVVEEWNATGAEYPRELCVHELFEARAERAPDAVAVSFEDRALSYAELNARANRLAHFLRARGVGPDVRVGVCVDRGLDMVTALLAVLKAGGAYVPLDPEYPEERLRYMLADSAPAVLLTQGSLLGLLALLAGDADVPVLPLDAPAADWDGHPATDPARDGLAPDHLAYVIYTSGSTGRPKGVMNAHRGVVNRLAWMQDAYGLGASDAVLQKTTFGFDVSVWEFFWTLGAGARLVMARPGGHRDPAYLAATVRGEGITTLHFVPSMLQLFLDHPDAGRCTGLRRVVCSGEALPAAVVAQFHERLPGVELHNLYGPTEAAVDVTAWSCDPAEDAVRVRVPLGRPIANTRMYVLDGAGNPAPAGVAGELYIGGVQVARGYLGRPELTAERFVPDALGGEAGARLYRTGDVGRWLPEGILEYLGRNDAQVKLRGFRIELGEIEARLLEHAEVREAAVLAREDAPGDRRLVAYYTAAAEAGVEALRAHLSARLPEYMVPAAYVRLETLPLTPSGKLDRKALPAPEGDAYMRRGYEAPAGETERALAEIWTELLGVERVGRWDHFFELGGHSMLAVRLIERMRRRGMHTEVGALFTTPTLAELAAAVGGESFEVAVPPGAIPAGCEAITPEMLPLVALSQAEIDTVVAGVRGGARNVQDVYPLAPLQEGMLFHHLLSTEGDPYLLASLSAFDTRESLDAHVGALQLAVDRHDILRTSVAWEGLREPVQVVWREARMEVEEVELDPAAGDAARQLWSRFDPRHHRLDVRRAPLVRASVARDAERGAWLLLLQLHHLAGDHTTLEVLQAEVGAHLRGRAHELPAPLPFRNYVAQARLGVSPEEHEAYFHALLAGVDEPTAPFGLLDAWSGGSGIEEARRPVDAALAVRLRERARALGVSAASVCHVAWAQVVAHASGRGDVVFGTVLFGRMQGGEGADRVMGPFINTLPVRLRVGAEGVEASVRGAHRQLAELLRHEHASLVLAQRCSAVRAPAPLFTALLNYRHSVAAPRTSGAGGSRGGGRRLHMADRTNYPVMLSVDDLGQGLALTAQVPASVGAGRLCGLMHRALECLVEALERSPGRALERVEVLPGAERRQVVEEWNATAAEYPREQSIQGLVEAQARRTPDAVAVAWEGGALGYAELNGRANRLAHFLRERGVGPEVRVGLCAERGPEMIVGLLAVLKAGGAYVPLDPEYPEDRLRHMLGDSAPAVLLTQLSLAERVSGLRGGVDAPVLALDDPAAPWAAHPRTDPEPAGLTPDHLAYILYTSGSTGRPKGVEVGHRSVVNRIAWMQRTYPLAAHDAMLQKTTYSFDVSVWEVFWPLAAGARIALARPQGHRDPAYLVEAIRGQAVTTVHFVPSMLQLFLEDAGAGRCTGLERVFCSGEALPAGLVRRFRERLPGVELHNWYGPTEAGEVSAWSCTAGEVVATVPIGAPIANTRLYVLDGAGEPVAAGVVGEVYIGGVAVGRGYRQRPELTAERFVPDAFGGEAGARLYRTGDLGRWLPDGTVEYLGRNDAQVKVRGLRIELGEIEARLAEHGAVRDAAVLAREDAPGDLRLVAYYVADGAIEPEALRAHLGERLPEHMVPAAYVHLDVFPLTPNGKLDRKALPAPEGDAFAWRGYEAPLGDTEQSVADIWSELLRVERVGRQDHFFELGGHSLLAVQLLSRVRLALGVEVALGEVFERPVLADFARGLAQAGRAELPPIDRVDRGGRLALSFAQQRLWFLERLGGMGSTYHIPQRLRLAGELDRDALARALDGIVARHEALRTTFAVVDGEPVQRIAPAEESRFHLVEHEPGVGPGAEAELRRLMAEEAGAPFDLERGPLIRGRLVRLAADDHVLLLTMHHIVSDAWSMGILVHELSVLYAAFRRGDADPLPPLPIQYADYAAWQRRWVAGEVLETQAAYWTRTLSGAPELLELPTDHARPAQQDLAGASVRVVLDEELTGKLKALGQRNGTTLFMTLLAGWAATLGRLSGQDDVVVGTPTANRGRSEVEGLVGFFVNTLALRVDLADSPTVAGLLARVRDRALEAQQNQDIPFEQVVEAVQPGRSLAHTPVFQVSFTWQNTPRRKLELPGLELGSATGWMSEGTAKFDLSLSLQESRGRIVGGFDYATALFERATVERHAGWLRRVLEAMAADDGRRVDRLEVLPEAERRQVVEEWNATGVAHPADTCVHELFEAQVERSPEAAAVVGGGEVLSYAELNARVNRLAHRLRELGVGPDARVGLCVERSLELVVGLLAVLKAGGAYVPLDPGYPPERLLHVLADSAPAVLLTQASLAGRFPDLDLPVIVLDADARADLPRCNPRRGELGPENLAYVIYTSGSTGTPKGVGIPHRALASHMRWMQRAFPLAAGDRVLQKTPAGFDASVWEFWAPLLAGATLVMAPPEVHRDPAGLLAEVARERITVLQVVPSLLRVLLEQPGAAEACGTLRRLFAGGEALGAELAARARSATGAEVVNLYGPTETCIQVTAHVCAGEGGVTAPIGRPVDNVRAYVLDGAGDPAGIGVPGELYVGGVQGARGYLGRPELTAAAFLPDPFSAEPGARTYRTGDRVRWLPAGELEYLGRLDQQVKVRGHRVEPGEIEAALESHPAVRAAVVTVREDRSGDPRLVGYVVGAGDAALSPAELRDHLRHLPQHMVPSAFVVMEALPLTPGGKTDRRALPAPEGDAYSTREFEAPEGETEAVLAEIWAGLLSVDRVGRWDNFFELGGHSLLAVTLVEQMRRRGLHAEVRSLFVEPTLSGFAAGTSQIREIRL